MIPVRCLEAAEGTGRALRAAARGGVEASDDDIAFIQSIDDLGVHAVADAELDGNGFGLRHRIAAGQAVNGAYDRSITVGMAAEALGQLDATLLGELLDTLNDIG